MKMAEGRIPLHWEHATAYRLHALAGAYFLSVGICVFVDRDIIAALVLFLPPLAIAFQIAFCFLAGVAAVASFRAPERDWVLNALAIATVLFILFVLGPVVGPPALFEVHIDTAGRVFALYGFVCILAWANWVFRAIGRKKASSPG